MRRVHRLQRLARREEENIVKRIFFLSAISIAIIIVFFTVGVPFLGRFADLLDSVFKNDGEEATSTAQLTAPILDSLPNATNEELITVSGFANNATKVEVWLNGDKAGEASVDGGRFEYQGLELVQGENEIITKALDSNGNGSEPSQTRIVVFDHEEPELEVTAPSDGQDITSNNRVKVEGKTEVDAQVYANGFLANVLSDGKFDVIIPLTEGENEIEVKASDEAGNIKTITIKVNFRK